MITETTERKERTMKHRPEPWTSRDAYSNGTPVESVIQCGSEILASVYDLGHDRRDEYVGNVRVMTSAPLLLRLVKDALAALEDPYLGEEDGERERPLRIRLAAAIAAIEPGATTYECDERLEQH